MQTMCRTIKFKCPLDEAAWVSDRRAPGADALRRQEGRRGFTPLPGTLRKGIWDPDTAQKEPLALGAASQNLAAVGQPVSCP